MSTKKKMSQETLMKPNFYMCYVQGCNTPTYEHPNRESAEAEAIRLSKMYPDKKVYILFSSGCFISELQVTTLYNYNV